MLGAATALAISVLFTVTILGVFAPAAGALPTPGFNGEEAREVTDRLFPEALETNDFIRFDEGLENLELLVEENPDLLTYHEIGSSYGWENSLTEDHDKLPVFAVTVTNKDSPVPADEKINLLFMLSIHANEKGAREGGMRIIEDFAKASAGDEAPGLLTPEHVDMLDRMQLIFLFPNPDGWAHEMAEYRHNDGGSVSVNGVETQNFIRGNGNGTDLNRQSPTLGWDRGEDQHESLKEPESRAYIPWLKETFDDIQYATDIHGMLYPANTESESSTPIQCVDVPGEGEVCHREGNFILSMLPAGPLDPLEHERVATLTRMLDDNFNDDPYYAEWQTLPGVGVWGDDLHGWGTVWDTIGYTDTGFSGDYFAQPQGLSAIGVDFEFSYNHITFDNYYPGLAQRINDYHVRMTRTIVDTFMDLAAEDATARIETDATTAYVPTDVVKTPADRDITGWAAANAADDAYHWENHENPQASLNAYFHDRAPFFEEGALGELASGQIAQGLAEDAPDQVVIPGSAIEQLPPAALEGLQAYIEEGGHVLLTDQALQALAEWEIVDDGDIQEATAYAGYTNWVDRSHPLTEGLPTMARQLYEPVPLGYSLEDGGASPVWSVNEAAFEDAGGETVGTFGEEGVNVGQLDHGEGTITLVGALLPDPTVEFNAPYGVAPYAVTYTGDVVVQNALGWSLAMDTTPIEEAAAEEGDALEEASEGVSSIPFPASMAWVAIVASLAIIATRRHA